jgi:hypothetical protein
MSQVVNAGKLMDDFKNLYSKAIQGNIDLVNRLSRVASDAAREFSTSAQSKTLPSPTKSLTQIAEFNLAYWSALTEHSLAFANEMAGAAGRAFGLECRQEENKAPMAIEVTAQPGQTAVAGFHVENTFSDPLEISFEAGDLVSPRGTTLKSKSVVFTPKQVTLAPKTQSVVQIAIEVPAECKPGESYMLPVKPVGFAMKQFSIKLNIAAPTAKAESTIRASAPKKRPKKG